MKSVIVIGGGLGGLISALQLVRNDIPCILIEKKNYPFHRVCGEYVSNEVKPFLQSLQLLPNDLLLPSIQRLQLSTAKGKYSTLKLDLGGFGISRYAFDHLIYQRAEKEGVKFILNTEVNAVSFSDEIFHVATTAAIFKADVVIGAFGKRSKLDVHLGRSFIKKRSPYVGVKYHVRTDHPNDLISLHNFPGGYCGINKVENDITTVCYMVLRKKLKEFGKIEELERHVLFKNKLLKTIFDSSEFIFDKPETINEISFATKGPIENHMLMVGDAAGMIAPLCGNGMAMAIHAGKIASELVTVYCRGAISRLELENRYTRTWRKNFAARLWMGRNIQHLFGNNVASTIALNMSLHVKPLIRFLIRQSHGVPF